jgi:two-component system, OmpR family, sensor histidine kinase CiaH
MFRGIGRRLAVLNAVTVIVVIALTGGITWLALRAALDDEVDNALRERIATYVDNPALFEDAGPTPTKTTVRDDDEDNEEHHDDDDEHDREIVGSGDTILFVVDGNGDVTFNSRGIELEDLPVEEAINRALAGRRDTRSVSLDESGKARVLTVPLREDGQFVGAVQAVRSLEEHDRELALVGWMTLLGVALGTLVAVPAGLYLSRRAMAPIDDAFRRQRAFVADASHELRTPLTLIRANAELSMLDPDRPVNESLSNILTEVDRTDRLVDDLLLLARADAGRLELHAERCRLDALVADAAESMRPLFEGNATQLEVTADTPVEVLADADRVRQVVRSLLDNALKHTSGGQVAVAIGSDGRWARVTVRDTGSDIPADALPHVFDRFYRVDKARSRSAGGTGLGLPIAKAIVEAHEGEITLASEQDHGTTVTFTLPDATR